jgi:hypothetical protein
MASKLKFGSPAWRKKYAPKKKKRTAKHKTAKNVRYTPEQRARLKEQRKALARARTALYGKRAMAKKATPRQSNKNPVWKRPKAVRVRKGRLEVR